MAGELRQQVAEQARKQQEKIIKIIFC